MIPTASGKLKSKGQSSCHHQRVIVHIDMDCFYVQVERGIDPSLVGTSCAGETKTMIYDVFMRFEIYFSIFF